MFASPFPKHPVSRGTRRPPKQPTAGLTNEAIYGVFERDAPGVIPRPGEARQSSVQIEALTNLSYRGSGLPCLDTAP
jgi:hypothetical protein